MRDKGVVQLEETFAPILFYGNTDLCSSDLLDLTEPTSPVPITYSPSMVQQQRAIRFLLENVHVFALKDGVSLYAPLYETMEQVRMMLYPFQHMVIINITCALCNLCSNNTCLYMALSPAACKRCAYKCRYR
jgi:hypothetical protein